MPMTAASKSWLALALIAAGSGAVRSEEKPSAPDRSREPILDKFSASKAAEFLDANVHATEKSCFACHGSYIYLMARPAIAIPSDVLPAEDPRIRRAVGWLTTHQRESGCWFTRSPRKDDERSTYAGTAYAILALSACGQIPKPQEPRGSALVPP